MPAEALIEFLRSKGKALSPLLILTHDHPDPDAMASAFGLAVLAERRFGLKARIAYGGLIGRMENQYMARTLKIPMHPLRERDLERFADCALVDTQPPFQNNPFPRRRRAEIVIDHHPRHPKTSADHAWIDESAGATSSMVYEALVAGGVEISPRLATALAYGIGSETQNLGREAAERDVAAYLRLIQQGLPKTLAKIQNPPRPRAFFEVLGRALQNAFVHRGVIGAHLGPVPHPDRVAQVADFLLTHERMRWSLCTGRYRGRLHVSVRARSPRAGAGRLLRRVLDGAGGGHSTLAGGAKTLPEGAGEEQWRSAEEAVTQRVLVAVGAGEDRQVEHPFRTGAR